MWGQFGVKKFSARRPKHFSFFGLMFKPSEAPTDVSSQAGSHFTTSRNPKFTFKLSVLLICGNFVSSFSPMWIDFDSYIDAEWSDSRSDSGAGLE